MLYSQVVPGSNISGSEASLVTISALVWSGVIGWASRQIIWTGESPNAAYVSPEVWRNRSCTVITRLAGKRSVPTVRSANSGRYSATGAAICSLPSSARIIAATEVSGLVIEAIRKIASSSIGPLASRSRQPKASAWAMRPPRAISTTAPGIMLRSTSCRNVAESRARRFAESPTSFGRSAFGNPRLAMSVREGRLGDLGLLELGQHFLPEPLQLLETDRFGDPDRQAHRHPIEARIAPFEALQMLDDLLG